MRWAKVLLFSFACMFVMSCSPPEDKESVNSKAIEIINELNENEWVELDFMRMAFKGIGKPIVNPDQIALLKRFLSPRMKTKSITPDKNRFSRRQSLTIKLGNGKSYYISYTPEIWTEFNYPTETCSFDILYEEWFNLEILLHSITKDSKYPPDLLTSDSSFSKTFQEEIAPKLDNYFNNTVSEASLYKKMLAAYFFYLSTNPATLGIENPEYMRKVCDYLTEKQAPLSYEDFLKLTGIDLGVSSDAPDFPRLESPPDEQ